MVLGLHPADLFVTLAYFLPIVSVGLTVARRVRGTRHYFMGGWRFGKRVMIAIPTGLGEAEGKGLLVVDLLSLPRRLSFRRYREDLAGFLVAWAVVLVLIAAALACAAIGAP